MKKLLQYTTIAALGLALLTSCKKSDPTPTALASVGKNSTSAGVDNSSASREITVSGLSGKIHEVKVNVIGSSAYTSDVQMYLKSPSGKMLQLCASESNAATYATINVTFTDAASTPVTNWKIANGDASFNGTFKPRGSLSAGYNGYTGTTPNLGGYKGNSPNGTWTLYFCDDEGGITSYLTSWELFISTVN